MDVDLTQDLVVYAPMIAALVAVVGSAGLVPARARGLLAVVFGVLLAAGMVLASGVAAMPALLQGIGAGLAATGAYEAVHQARKDDE